MKENAKKALIKDIIIAVVAWIAIALLINVMMEGVGFFICLVPGFFLAGIPFGWRWLSKVITAVSLWGILIKFLGALFLGFIALPVILAKDVINYVRA